MLGDTTSNRSSILVGSYNCFSYSMEIKEKVMEEVTISKEEYEALKQADAFLDALKEAGVDNWDGYDYALDILNE